jgi:hypothetical protein
MSGPEGFLPFVRSVLSGVKDYEAHLSPRAILRGRQADSHDDG